jgi:hypothetical protein
MGISSILDIAIGLIFTYLIVSLLASEIQELITTILQWRAVHLKESIEGLLADHKGDKKSLKNVRELANKIYANPLVKDLNHEARGFASLPRLLNQFVGRLLTLSGIFSRNKEGVFGKANSGPSYISKEVFASSLFETLQIPHLTHTIISIRLKEFLSSKEVNWKDDEVLKRFRDDQVEIFRDFDNVKINLSDVLDRLAESAKQVDFIFKIKFFDDVFEDHFQEYADNSFGLSIQRKEILLQQLTPSLTEVVEIVIDSPTAQLKEIRNQLTDLNIDFSKFPMTESLKNSLSDLARRSQAKVEDLEKQVNQFQKDVEDWFDKSMDRANGVYKRNARLIAFLIGLMIAIAGNVNSFHIVDRLSKDKVLRDSISRTADSIVAQNIADKKGLDPTTIKKLNDEAEKISLPIGWKLEQGKNWIDEIKKEIVSSPITVLFGWLISAIAISMGSSFWFDLLGKFVNVKNAGKISSPSRPNTSDSP